MGETVARGAPLRASASVLCRILRSLTDILLEAVIFVLVLLFILQFIHSPKLLSLAWIAGLKRTGEVLVTEVNSWSRPGWPVDTSFSFVPLVTALLVWLVKIGVDGIFLKASGTFSRRLRGAVAQGAVGKSGGPGGVSSAANIHRVAR